MSLIKYLLICVLLALPVSTAAAQQDTLSSMPGNVLVMRGLDKVTARTQDFEIRIGEEYQFGSLTILPRYCRERPPEETPEIFVFVEIYDRRGSNGGIAVEEGEQGERVFSGWMFASNPALNPLEHPVYDVWPIDCRT
ncbi:MAG: hypothetical protein DHS20C06_14350 [Hyphobacterium sp.]|nr:MAG: hypothetical protein DHS20C06_14350 [Hyphobacterium sp.]